MTIERLPAKDYAPREVSYIDVLELHSLYELMVFRANLLLVGPKGVGKSLSIQAFASKIKSPIITFDCSEDVRRSHLVGMHLLRGQETPFVLGPLTTAFEIANEVGQCILVLEEVSALTPQAQKLLNPLGDFRRSITVPECKQVFRLNEGAKLWLVGTMNTSNYGGVFDLNEDLKSRFRILTLDYPDLDVEIDILQGVIEQTKLSPEVINGILTLAHETRQKVLQYALSTRDVAQIIEDAWILGLRHALRLALGKFEGDDRVTVKARMNSIFTIPI